MKLPLDKGFWILYYSIVKSDTPSHREDLLEMQGIKHLAGGRKIGLNWDDISFSMNHRQRARENVEDLTLLRRLLVQAEEEGKHSKAKKLRRLINKEFEVGLYLTHSSCGTCHLFLHLCTCKED